MIKVDKISKKFDNSLVLDNISIDFNMDTITSIVAPNGTGKTTFINILSGLLLPDKGKIEYMDLLDSKDVVILQQGEKNLYMKNTVKENINYFGVLRGISTKEIEEELKYYSEFIPIYDELKHRMVEELSFGQKRIVSILAAVAAKSKCIILDEASEGLDMNYVNILINLIKSISRNKIIILVSHDYKFISLVSNKIIFIKDGEIVSTYNEITEEDLEIEYKKYFTIKELN